MVAARFLSGVWVTGPVSPDPAQHKCRQVLFCRALLLLLRAANTDYSQSST
jgi:hypothetical protein